MKIDSYPKVIEIQFHNKCNSNCLICPYKDMMYEYSEMQNSLFEKFLNQIDENKLKRLIPYLNNEPFLDPQFVNKIKEIRNKFKNIEIEISSNVSVIKRQDMEELAKLDITELRLSVFGYSEETYKKMMPNLNKDVVFSKLEMISKIFNNSKTIVSIVMIDNDEIEEEEFTLMKQFATKLGFNFERWGYLDRSNNVVYKSNNIFNNNVCNCEQNRPLERMHILANGNVIFCCQDWAHTTILGNINENTISEIWNGFKYKKIRESLYNNNKKSPNICVKCKLGH